MTKQKALQLIEKHAYAARKWAEKRAQKLGFDSNLEGMCAVASGELFKRLKKAKLKPVLVFAELEWCGHAFVVCNNYIVDITATQFDDREYGSVEIVKRCFADDYQAWSGEVEHIAKTIKGALKYQKKVGWPPSQQVRTR